MVGWLALGVAIGLAVLTKLSGALLLLPAALAVVLVAQQRADSRLQLFSLPERFASLSRRRQSIGVDVRHLAAAGFAIGLPVLALTGWWFWRNWQLYGDPTGLKMFNPYFTRAVPADLAQIWSERSSFLYGYWGNFGGLNLPIPSWAYTALNVLLGLAAIGLLVSIVRSALRCTFTLFIFRSLPLFRGTQSAFVIRQPIFIIALWGIIVFIGWTAWTRTTWSSQGRLVFYALPAYSILMVAGLTVWLPRRIAGVALGIQSAGMMLLSAAMPFMVIGPAYARPPQLTPAQIAGIPNRVDVTFGDALMLLGYDAPVTLTHPGEALPITLYWQALRQMERDYSVFVHLLDENDIEVQDQSRSQAYPGRGNLPTTTLVPGQTWAETWIMPIQPTAYAPARLTWEIGLFDMVSPQKVRLPVTGRAGQALGDNIRFGQIELARLADSSFNPVSYNFGDQIELIGFELNRRAATPGETIDLTLYWRALAVPVRNYTIFAHVLGEQQTKAAAVDMQPSPPTLSWQPGQVISSTYPLRVQAVPPGVYDIMVGVYYFTGPASLERLKILTRDGRQQQDYVLLGKLRVIK